MNRDIRRYDEIDIMKGLGIILIILGHLEPSTYLMRFVYSFHLFVFFTCSGFVGTRYLTRGFRSIICNNIKRLLIPYIVWNILSQTVDIMCGTINTVQAINNILFLNANCGWNAALWFLASLFWIDSLGALIIKSIKSYYLQMSICLLFGILWIFMWTNKLILPFGLYTIPAGMIFWFIGYYFNITHTLNYLLHIGNKGLFYIGFLGGGVNLLGGVAFNKVISIYHINYYNIPLTIIGGIAGTALIMTVAVYLNKGCKLRTFIILFGRNTLLVLCTHYFLLRLIGTLGMNFVGYNLWRYTSTPKSIVFTLLVILFYYSIIPQMTILKEKFVVLKYFI